MKKTRINYKEYTERLLGEHGLKIEGVLKGSTGWLTIMINGKGYFAEDWARAYYFFLGYFHNKTI